MSDDYRPLGLVIFVRDSPGVYHVLSMSDYCRVLDQPSEFCTGLPVYYCFRTLGHVIFVRALYSVLNAIFRPLGPCYVLTFVSLHFL